MQAADDDLGAAFARLRQSLRSYLRRRVPDPAQAEDLLQDVFVKALASQQAGRHIDNLTGWLYAAARTAVADHYRSAGVSMEALDDEMPSAELDDMRMHQALSACLRPFVDQLAPRYREALIATDFEGETMRSVAERQGVSVSAIKSRVARARAMLKDKVLACCHVEITDATVSDYHRISSSSCGGKCT
ncbi:RNA polymerase subunit sigma-70 [Parazoarcus communis]|uniref:RNA polymerase subunit sigma-70 n=1 Tax=Parazoarcus communis TaxID=41977 RepID=A0A2U8H1R3_9RHOO|nr:sigma-70 family RNA polymerase sigma factor [Parazoarcus communis]AWI79503.1 RNA polymerase subunit sigma-70 [Parazoarcus communis]